MPAGLFRPGPSNAEHVDCPFDHAYHIIQPIKNIRDIILIPKKKSLKKFNKRSYLEFPKSLLFSVMFFHPF